MIRFFHICAMIFFGIWLNAQQPGNLELIRAERELELLFSQLYSDTLSSTDPILDSIRALITDALSIEGSMDYPWSRLTMIGRISMVCAKERFTWLSRVVMK